MPFHRSNLATLSQATYNYLDANGFPADDIFERAGINPADRMNPNHRNPVSASLRLWRIATLETKNPAIVYEIVNYLEPWMMHAVGHAWIASATLLDGLQRMERYHRMLSTNVMMKLERLQGAWQLSANVIDPFEHPATDAVVAMILALCRKAYGEDLKPLQAELVRLEPLDADKITNFFGCDVSFGHSENVIVFNGNDLNRRLRSGNPIVASAMDEVIIEYLAQQDAEDTASRVRQVVAGQLVHGEPTKNDIAAELNMSSRTLQRRLEEQGTSIKSIIDATRHQLALEYLAKQHLSIKEVAYSLGFNDASNFSRAFKRWQGVTPKQFRQAV